MTAWKMSALGHLVEIFALQQRIFAGLLRYFGRFAVETKEHQCAHVAMNGPFAAQLVLAAFDTTSGFPGGPHALKGRAPLF